jgi:hypothetical protein
LRVRSRFYGNDMRLQEGGLTPVRDGRQRLGERRRQRVSRDKRGSPRSIEAGGELGEEHGALGAPRGEEVLRGRGNPRDEPLESEAAPIVGPWRPRVGPGRARQQGGNGPSQGLGRAAAGDHATGGQRPPERHHPLVAQAPGQGAVPWRGAGDCPNRGTVSRRTKPSWGTACASSKRSLKDWPRATRSATGALPCGDVPAPLVAAAVDHAARQRPVLPPPLPQPPSDAATVHRHLSASDLGARRQHRPPSAIRPKAGRVPHSTV